jgi:hypothetical protein
MVAEHRHQARDREADEDHVLDQPHADLGARRDPDAGHRDDEHDQDDGRADEDIGPRAGGTGAAVSVP